MTPGKSEAVRLTVAEPVVTGVHRYQTDAPAVPAGPGSPGSVVAPMLSPLAVVLLPPTSGSAATNMSLAGTGRVRSARWNVPCAAFEPSTAMRYVVPAAARK